MASPFEAILMAQTNFLLNPPVATITQATGQSIPSGSPTAITFDASVQDTYSGHSTTVNNTRYTSQVAGTYWIYGNVSIASGSATGLTYAVIYKNGSQIAYTLGPPIPNTTAVSVVASTATQIQLNVGDYVELRITQSTGVAQNTNPAICAMYIAYVHA